MLKAIMAGNPDHAPPAGQLAPSLISSTAAFGQGQDLGQGLGQTPQPAERREFRALITPHRSLGANGFRLVMALVLVCSVVASLPFVLLGAWPVAGFFGLDVLGLYLAFRLSFTRASAFEEIVVTGGSLILRKVSHTGAQVEWRFNPLWTTLIRENDTEFGLLRLSLASRGEVAPVGEALSAAERESLAAALSAALGAARRGELRQSPF